MASSSYRPAPDRQSPRRRAVSFGLAIAAHLIVVLLLLRLAPRLDPPVESSPLSTFALDAERPVGRTAPATRRAATKRATTQSATAPPPTPPPPIPPPVTEAPAKFPAMLSDTFDLAAVPRRSGDQGDTDGDDRADSVAAYGPGAGPGGQRLYNADWQREPTDAEINGYIRGPVPPGSWAVIACRTIDDNRVDNCRIVGEAPLGSGFARSMREAAWQFRVLPPRSGGQRLLGSWVQICIDLRPDEQGRVRCRPRRG